MLDLGTTLDNFSLLLGIDLYIIPTIITLLVIIFLIFLSFKMELGGLMSAVVLLALYTVTMGILSFLNIDSALNIFSLLGETLGETSMVIPYGY